MKRRHCEMSEDLPSLRDTILEINFGGNVSCNHGTKSETRTSLDLLGLKIHMHTQPVEKEMSDRVRNMHKPIQMLGLFTCGSGRFVTQLTSQNAGPFQGVARPEWASLKNVFLFADAIPDEANVHDYNLPCISRIKVNYKFRSETRQPYTSTSTFLYQSLHPCHEYDNHHTWSQSLSEICDTAPGGCMQQILCTVSGRDMHEFLCKVKTVYRGQNTNLKPLIHLNMYSNRMEISDVHHTVSAMTASMRPSLYFADNCLLSTPKCQDKCTDHGSTTPEDNWIRSSYRRSCVMGKIAWPLQQVNGLIAALDLYPHASSYDMDLIICSKHQTCSVYANGVDPDRHINGCFSARFPLEYEEIHGLPRKA